MKSHKDIMQFPETESGEQEKQQQKTKIPASVSSTGFGQPPETRNQMRC